MLSSMRKKFECTITQVKLRANNLIVIQNLTKRWAHVFFLPFFVTARNEKLHSLFIPYHRTDWMAGSEASQFAA